MPATLDMKRMPEEVGRCWAPPRRDSLAQWLPKNFRFDSKSGALPGYWNHAVFPYSLGVLEALEDPDVKEVVLSWGTRLGKTAIITGYVAWCVENDPCPIQITCPDQDSANEHYDTKLEPALEACPSTSSRLLPEHRRLKERVDLGSLYIYYGWLGAPRTLSARSIAKQVISEANKGGRSQSLEGDVIRQARDRGKDWMISSSYKLIIEGTPNIRGECRITAALEQSNRCRYQVPCPHCHHYQYFRMGSREEKGGLKWQHDKSEHSDPDVALQTAYYQCENCEVPIHDHHKVLMNRKGVWVPNGQRVREVRQTEAHTGIASDGTRFLITGTATRDKRISGFGPLPSMHSSLLTFGMCAKDFIESTRSGIGALQNHVNGWLGEPFELRGRRATTDEILAHSMEEHHPGYIPCENCVVVCAVDVQQDCLYFEVRAWAEGGTCWTTLYGRLPQDNLVQGTDFDKLEGVLKESYQGENLSQHRIRLVLVDSGYAARQNEVYDWCQLRQPWAVPCKGRREAGSQSQLNVLHVSKVPNRADMPLWRVDPFQGNNQLYDNRLTIKRGMVGYWGLHSGVGQDYSSHFLTMRRSHEKNKKTGMDKVIWVQEGTNDHYVDCARLQEAAAFHYGFGVKREKKVEKPPQNRTPHRSHNLSGPGGW